MTTRRAPVVAVLAGLSTYLAWGFFAENFQLIINRGIPADVLLTHRITWSSAFCVLLIVSLGAYGPVLNVLRDRRRLASLSASAVLVAINWLSFIYAIQTNRRTEATLGYFINPLLTVALGVVLLGERLGRVQWLCVALASGGVTTIVFDSGGRVPWIAISISLSFAF